MSAQKLGCLLVLIFIALASMCLVPVGHGPSSAVYGPATAFRAYRASLELRRAVVAIVALLIVSPLALLHARLPEFEAGLDVASADCSSLIPILRC